VKQKRFVSPGEVVNPEIYEKALRVGLKAEFPKSYIQKAKKNFSPSKLGFGAGKCPRMWYYLFEGNLEHTDSGDHKSQLKRLFGTKYHEIVQAFMPQDQGWVYEEKVINDYPPVFGFVDIYDKKNNVPVEMKNVDTVKFNKGKELNMGEESHVIQTLMYMKIKKASQGVLFYIDRTTLDTHAFSIIMTPFHEAYIDGLFRWMDSVHTAWRKKQLPKRPPEMKKGSFPCSYCPLQKHCWDDPNEGVVEIRKAKDLTYN